MVVDEQLLAKESFVLIDPNGTISARFEPEAGGFDEGMRRAEFVTIDGSMREPAIETLLNVSGEDFQLDVGASAVGGPLIKLR